MMPDEDFLLRADAVSGKLKSTLLDHIGRATAFFAIVICAIFTFTEIAFVDISFEKFTVEGIVILVMAMVMYLSLESEGEAYAKGQNGYLEAKGCADALAVKVRGDALPDLRKYLLHVYEDEVRAREDRLLLMYGLTRAELEKYRQGERFGKKKSHQLRCVAKTTSRALTPSELLFFEGVGGEEITSAPRKRGRFLGIVRILPSVLCTLLTVGVMIDLKDGFSLRLILEGILKLSALLSMGLRGYLAGVHYVGDVLTPYHKVREKLLDAFLQKEE